MLPAGIFIFIDTGKLFQAKLPGNADGWFIATNIITKFQPAIARALSS